MFHACVQRFDEMDENSLGGELNRALLLVPPQNLKVFKITCHIESLDICMEY